MIWIVLTAAYCVPAALSALQTANALVRFRPSDNRIIRSIKILQWMLCFVVAFAAFPPRIIGWVLYRR